RVDAMGQETVLHSFTGLDGSAPSAVVRDTAGNLYGTSQVTSSRAVTGVVFRLSPTGQFTALHEFSTSHVFNGTYPQAGLIVDAAGDLYGTAAGGFFTGGPANPSCARGCGVVFKLDSAGNEETLYRFPVEPENPVGGLIRDASGTLY